MPAYPASQPTHPRSVAPATSPKWLTAVLWVDGLTGLASAMTQLAFAKLLSDLYGLPTLVIQVSAGVVLVFVAFIAALLAKPQPAVAGLRMLVVGNALWVLASLVVVVLYLPTLTMVGLLYGVAQAGFVALLAYFQARAAWHPMR
jgi:hypothetical protein